MFVTNTICLVYVVLTMCRRVIPVKSGKSLIHFQSKLGSRAHLVLPRCRKVIPVKSGVIDTLSK